MAPGATVSFFSIAYFSFSILNSSLYLLRAEKVKFISKSIVLVISSGDLVVTNNKCFDCFYMFLNCSKLRKKVLCLKNIQHSSFNATKSVDEMLRTKIFFITSKPNSKVIDSTQLGQLLLGGK